MEDTPTNPSAPPPYRTSSPTTSPPPPAHKLSRLPFAPLTKSHILHCSYHSWYPRYRRLTPASILIPLPPAFLAYLRSDGIILPPTTSTTTHPDPLTPPDSDADDEGDSWSDSQPDSDPSLEWADVHTKIKEGIKQLGGKVLPKLNWSAPKDATWMVAGNSMECGDAGDVYLLLKSSDFVTHDLEEWAGGCVPDPAPDPAPSNPGGSGEEMFRKEKKKMEDVGEEEVPYHLILRKPLPNFNPACEFRCFVRARRLLCVCQRDLNHYDFLAPLRSRLLELMQDFFEDELRDTFEEEDFVFDVYVPVPRSERVWLIDVNPWAERTDPILFSWLEILNMWMPAIPRQEEMVGEEVLRVRVQGQVREEEAVEEQQQQGRDDGEDEEDVEDLPELRLVGRDDPEAYAFNTPQYSAHKLPKDVVDAGNDGEAGLREFLGTWREIERRQAREDADSVSDLADD